MEVARGATSNLQDIQDVQGAGQGWLRRSVRLSGGCERGFMDECNPCLTYSFGSVGTSYWQDVCVQKVGKEADKEAQGRKYGSD